VCVPDDAGIKSVSELSGRRVATSFPRVSEAFFKKHQADVHLVPLSGSVEVMIALGVADAIVDLVETGSTLAANRLMILDEIGRYETILVQNHERRHAEQADRIVRRPVASRLAAGAFAKAPLAEGLRRRHGRTG